MEDWEEDHSDVDFKLTLVDLKIDQEENEEIEIEDDPVVIQTMEDPEFEFCTKPDYASVYCSGAAGVGKNAKAAISCTIINHMGVIVDDYSKYVGDGLTKDQLYANSVRWGLEKVLFNQFDKVWIYTDYNVPPSSVIKSFTYKHPKHQWNLKVIVDKFKEYRVVNIPRKLNIVTTRLAEESLTQRKKEIRKKVGQQHRDKLNNLAFKNRS